MSETYWHLWSVEYPADHELAGSVLTIVVGPTSISPDAARARPDWIFRPLGATAVPYCASFDHEPADTDLEDAVPGYVAS